MADRRVLADAADVARMVRRLALEIVERHRGVGGIALVGIRTGGLHVAERLRAVIAEVEGTAPPLGAIDIALYRDDVGFDDAGRPRAVKPVIGATELPFALDGLRVVLVDDVLYTGRTVRAALDALMDYGRPRAVELAVLVDRGLRELPIRADYTGTSIDSRPEERVLVTLRERGDADQIVIGRVPGAGATP
ncbi:MAG: bifunctional pyr operon transcriptional regulator/uracil phosphoribosyltransferase PyrR [Kofleriaceae bacterium]|nr:bifunctional pyr operon transcriptional regulator/uracil phosphoribosyltransferase PyrR [Kofleriaceae bacterium]MCB9571476.1 bifunctional pyr operon transcriptional regulator/uracil phosphoribosyltransferase PyrR [Kofleriaceae bacterium]